MVQAGLRWLPGKKYTDGTYSSNQSWKLWYQPARQDAIAGTIVAQRSWWWPPTALDWMWGLFHQNQWRPGTVNLVKSPQLGMSQVLGRNLYCFAKQCVVKLASEYLRLYLYITRGTSLQWWAVNADTHNLSKVLRVSVCQVLSTNWDTNNPTTTRLRREAGRVWEPENGEGCCEAFFGIWYNPLHTWTQTAAIPYPRSSKNQSELHRPALLNLVNYDILKEGMWEAPWGEVEGRDWEFLEGGKDTLFPSMKLSKSELKDVLLSSHY